MVKIDASSEYDVTLLAGGFLTTPKEDQWKVIAKVYDLGLMNFRGIGWILWTLKKVRGSIGVFQFFKILSEKSPKSIDKCIEDIIMHIVKGKDATDTNSVGGWNQAEIDLLLKNVTFSVLKNKEDKNEV